MTGVPYLFSVAGQSLQQAQQGEPSAGTRNSLLPQDQQLRCYAGAKLVLFSQNRDISLLYIFSHYECLLVMCMCTCDFWCAQYGAINGDRHRSSLSLISETTYISQNFNITFSLNQLVMNETKTSTFRPVPLVFIRMIQNSNEFIHHKLI